MTTKICTVLAVVGAVAGPALAGIVEWNPVWSPPRGLDVKVERFTMSNASTGDARSLLNNEAGLSLGFADGAPAQSRPHHLTLDLRNQTVQQIEDAVALRSPEYTFQTYDGVAAGDAGRRRAGAGAGRPGRGPAPPCPRWRGRR